MSHYRTRICLCYLITAFLMGSFVYLLVTNNLENQRTLNRLREEVDEIAHMMLHSVPAGEHEHKQLTEVVDSILKKRLAGIWDDIYTVKKQLKATECANLAGRKSAQPCDLSEKGAGRINYASDELGARIHDVQAEPVTGTNILKSLMNLDFTSNPPINMLRQSMEPGNCFAFRKCPANVFVKLAKEIFVESIEYEHISKGLSPTADISSAPKEFSVFSHNPNYPKKEQALGTFQYDNTTVQPIQSYPVTQIVKCRFLRFKFQSNHGNPNYTCIYRIAVFGKL